VAHLVQRGIETERILLCTFTNKAAREMVGRVEWLLGCSLESMWAGTFHHIGNRFLRRHAERLGFQTNYSILDRDDANQLLDSVIAEQGYGPQARYRFPNAKALSGAFNIANATGESIEDVVLNNYTKFSPIVDEIGQVWRKYNERKFEINAMDFDDLLILWYKLLCDHPELRDHYARYFVHLLVDEYQDTNPLQASIIDLLAEHHRNITVVGDDAQSIYRFRGADCQNILDFPKRYSNCTTYYLCKNYRSTPQILETGNRVIAYNINQFPKNLEAVRNRGVRPSVVMAENGQREAQWIANQVSKLKRSGIALRDIAVLYRIHSHSLELQIALQHIGIPFVVRSGMRFFEQAHIKDLLAWLRLLYNQRDILAWQRILDLFQGIGAAAIKKIIQQLATLDFNWQALSEPQFLKKLPEPARKSTTWLCRLLEESSLPENLTKPGKLIQIFFEQEYENYLTHTYDDVVKRVEDIKEFILFANSYKNLADFLGEMMLQTDLDAIPLDEDQIPDDALILSTVHQAKGLEWQVVFCLNLVEGNFPFFLALDEDGGLEEERRLFYVATTRAKDQLYLCSRQTFVVKSSGLQRSSVPSRFLWEILCEYEEHQDYTPSGPLSQFLLEAERQSVFNLIFS
jgi:DNA helicase-2/ATP-dependent DNA helicase PcrA